MKLKTPGPFSCSEILPPQPVCVSTLPWAGWLSLARAWQTSPLSDPAGWRRPAGWRWTDWSTPGQKLQLFYDIKTQLKLKA